MRGSFSSTLLVLSFGVACAGPPAADKTGDAAELRVFQAPRESGRALVIGANADRIAFHQPSYWEAR